MPVGYCALRIKSAITVIHAAKPYFARLTEDRRKILLKKRINLTDKRLKNADDERNSDISANYAALVGANSFAHN